MCCRSMGACSLGWSRRQGRAGEVQTEVQAWAMVGCLHKGGEAVRVPAHMERGHALGRDRPFRFLEQLGKTLPALCEQMLASLSLSSPAPSLKQ